MQLPVGGRRVTAGTRRTPGAFTFSAWGPLMCRPSCGACSALQSCVNRQPDYLDANEIPAVGRCGSLELNSWYSAEVARRPPTGSCIPAVSCDGRVAELGA